MNFRFIREILIIFCLLFVQNNFLYKKNLTQNEPIINADGRGYYEYLPAVFIYKDIHLNYLDTLKTDFYSFDLSSNFYPSTINGHRLDKFFVGTAVFQTPFFLLSDMVAKSGKSKADGFSITYQKGMLYAAIFYLFVGLIFLRWLLQSYNINGWWIAFAQLTILFGTPLLHYTLSESAYSHVYSFFLISGFLWSVRYFFITDKKKYIIIALIILGFIVIVRPVNILVLLFTPLLTSSFKHYLEVVQSLFKKHLKTLFVGLICFFAVLSIQFYVSYLQTGSPLNYNYGDEGFNFTNPQFINFLFSYRKGFFLWTPWWFVVFLLSLFVALLNKKYYQIVVFSLGFITLTYVLSSWWAWSYGGSLGQRPMVDFNAVFVLALIPILRKSNLFWKGTLLFFAFPLVYVMQMQTIQYEKAIIQWDGMTKESYWEVFLNLNEKYSWYFWKEPFHVGELQNKKKMFDEIQMKSIDLDTSFIVPNGMIDTTSHFGEIRMNLDREPDKEFMEIYFFSEKDSVIHYAYQRLFYNNEQRINVVYRFELPEQKEKIARIRYYIQNVSEPLTIKSATFATYKSLNSN